MKIEHRRKLPALIRFWDWCEKHVVASYYLIAIIIHKVNTSRNFEFRSLS